jgi:hypothetical protein
MSKECDAEDAEPIGNMTGKQGTNGKRCDDKK